MSEDDSAAGILFEITMLAGILILAFSPFIVEMTDSKSHDLDTETDMNRTGAFTEERLDQFCKSQGHQQGYYSEYFNHYTCYTNEHFNQTEVESH